jgi:hypothetical protein
MDKKYRVEGCFSLAVDAEDIQRARTKAQEILYKVSQATGIGFCIVSVVKSDE